MSFQIAFEHIQQQYPQGWKEFNDFYTSNYSITVIKKTDEFCLLPFAFQLGVFIDFFNTNGLELDVQSLNFELIIASIQENFEVFEKTINHYS